MKKIVICLLAVIAFACIFTSKVHATAHVAMMDKEYLEFQQQKYRERIKREREEEKAKAAAKAEAEAKSKVRKEEKEAEKQSKSSEIKVTKGSAEKLTAQDMELLSKICHAESRGEGEKGQMAVANVILNRVKSSKFPNTIKGVIYQKGQFTPVASNSFNSIVPSSQVRSSVQKVIDGERVLSDDVLYFKSVNSGAKWGKYTLKAQIGKHLFYAG